MSTASQLPDSGWLTVAAIVVAILALGGIAILFQTAKSLRSGLAEIVKTELAGAKEEARVAVQGSLVVTPAEKFVTREEHGALAKKMDEELGRERSSRKRMHEEIAGLQGDVKVLRSQNEQQTRQIAAIDGKMDQVLLRLPRSKP